MGRASKNSTLYTHTCSATYQLVRVPNPSEAGNLFLDNQELLSFSQLSTQLHPSLLLLVLDLLILMTVMMMTLMIIMTGMMTRILY